MSVLKSGSEVSLSRSPRIEAIDLFCGAGGLSYGLRQAGVHILAGVDIDPMCRFPFEENNAARYISKSVVDLTGDELKSMYSPGAIKLIAGCAPCQPFSTLSNGRDLTTDNKWKLLDEFTRIVESVEPDLVTMENVPKVKGYAPYERFVSALLRLNYKVFARSIRCADFGIPQERRRFVLLASRLGEVHLEIPRRDSVKTVSVLEAIGDLPVLGAGEVSQDDPLHKARSLTPINLERIRASKPGGTWNDWPEHLRSPCHKKNTGSSFRAVYARMKWEKPSPTITTQFFNFGTGRFGHPEQDRGITPREAAILQSFPRGYKFIPKESCVHFSSLGRLIGNAVPPRLGEVIGETFVRHVESVLCKNSRTG